MPQGRVQVFSIADYDELYRPYDKSGGELKSAVWVKLPANPRGRGLKVLLKYKRGLEVFGIWCLLLEITTLEKPENRGQLLNHRGLPASVEEIAEGISLPKNIKLVSYALSILAAIGWVSSEVTSAKPELSSSKSRVEKSRVEKSKVVISLDDFIQYWNTKTNLPKVQSATTERKRKFRTRMSEPVFAGNWRKVVDSLSASDFHIGKNDRGWRANVDWIFKDETNYTKILEQQATKGREQGAEEQRKANLDRKKKEQEKDYIRREYTKFIQEHAKESLIKMRKNPVHQRRWWLIDELRPEIKPLAET